MLRPARFGQAGYNKTTNPRGSLTLIHPAWENCLDRLQAELPAAQFNIWIQPLRPNLDGKRLRLLAPNRYIRDWVAERYLNRIAELLREVSNGELVNVDLGVGDVAEALPSQAETAPPPKPEAPANRRAPSQPAQGALRHTGVLEAQYTFDNFVEGKSNALALAAARQVAENPGGAYNPLFIYGGVGLGKTHLMHAIGNAMMAANPDAKVVYLRSEQFVDYMVKAIQLNAMADFQKFFRSQDALLIDDIQFLAKKDRSQEEFFHTFNALFEGGQQMIFTCDRYPREISGLEERLKSRFGWGLPVAVEPPELETRAAILMRKAAQAGVELPQESALFMAQKIRANVRELEGALTRVIASARFTSRPLDVGLIRESLKDLLAVHDRMISLDNIQRTVAEYYKIRIADLSSKRRNRSIARPRQVAMALAKELTSHSLPEIGDSFGGRDHTTVLHACRKIEELKETTSDIREDYNNLLRLLTT